jgi:hypothetical protein
MHYAIDNTPDTLIGPDEFVDLYPDIKKMLMTNELFIPGNAKPEKPSAVLLNWEKKGK